MSLFFLISFLEQKFINFVDLTVLGVTDFSVSFFFNLSYHCPLLFLDFMSLATLNVEAEIP